MQHHQDRVLVLEKEVMGLQDDKEKLEQVQDNQLEEIQRLRNVQERNLELIEEVKEVTQKNKELHYKISRLHKEIEESGKPEQDDLLNTLKTKLAKLYKEKSHFEEKEKEYERQMEELKDENGKLRRALTDSDRMRGEMNDKMEAVIHELNNLKRQSTQSARERQHFKDFVQLKRDMGLLRQENDELKTRLKLATGNGKMGNLPSLKFTNGTQGNKDKKIREGKSETHAAIQWKSSV